VAGPTTHKTKSKAQAPLTKQTTAKAQRDNIMALRRPPTRIDLKADDVEEYDKVRLLLYYLLSIYTLCSAVLCVYTLR
jgi:hypothetical protein